MDIECVSQLLFALYQGSREQPMDTFQQWALNAVRAIVPFDAAAWISGTLAEGQHQFHSVKFIDVSPQVLTAYEQCEGRLEFTQQVFATPGRTLACATAGLAPPLAALCAQYRIAHILATVQYNPISRLSELISLYRSDAQQPFSEPERQLQQSLVPHLCETWRVNRMLHAWRLARPTLAQEMQAAVCDRHGVLQASSPRFVEHLLREWPAWRGPQLPPELQAQLRHGKGRYVGARTTTHSTQADGWWLLHMRPRCAADQLTAREREIATHFAQGRSRKEIAKHLALSPSTVRNHLAATYQKLDISSKAQLASCLQS